MSYQFVRQTRPTRPDRVTQEWKMWQVDAKASVSQFVKTHNNNMRTKIEDHKARVSESHCQCRLSERPHRSFEILKSGMQTKELIR